MRGKGNSENKSRIVKHVNTSKQIPSFPLYLTFFQIASRTSNNLKYKAYV